MKPKSSQRASLRRKRQEEPLFQWHWPSGTAIAMLALGCLIGAGMWRQWVWLLDTFTLMLHEAGHPILGMFSPTLTVYGGTVFQLMFPWLTKRHFQKKENSSGVVFAHYWMAASIHNVGIYMADARAKQLPLIGGLDPEEFHDWAEILSRWGLLRYDTALGKMLMLFAWGLLLWAMWRCYHDVKDTGFGSYSSSNRKEEELVEKYQHLRVKPEEGKKDALPQEKEAQD